MPLGFDPNEDTLLLSEGAEFVCSFTEDGVQWPEGTECTLEFPTLVGVGPYTAVVNETAPEGGTASFVIPRVDTTSAKIPAKTPYRVYLAKDHRYLWFRGKVVRED